MSAPIVAITNRKGGVGKSTMSVHVAAGLSTLGYRVGLVDTDSQGHAGLMLNMPDADGLYAALVEKRPLANCVLPVDGAIYSTADRPARGSLYLLPSSQNTYQVQDKTASDPFLFLETIEEMIEQFALDIVIVDTAPTLSAFDAAIYMAADAFMYITEPERLSLDGVIAAIDQMRRFNAQRVKYLQRSSQILGIIPNKVRNTLVHDRNIASLTGHFGALLWSPIALRTLWTESSNVNQTIFTYAPSGKEAADAWTIVNRVREALWATEASNSPR